jgi:hypothetical protein
MNEEDRIQQILDEIRDFKFEFIEFKTKIDTELMAKEKECASHKSKTSAIEKAIYGNGQKGLKQQISEIETKIALFSGFGSVAGSAVITLLWKMLTK